MSVVKIKVATVPSEEPPVVLAPPEPLPKTPPSRLSALPARESLWISMLRSGVSRVLPPALGLLLFVLLWAQISVISGLPGPIKTWAAATELFAHPFYVKGPNDQGIGWNVLHSLARVGIG